MPAEQYAEMPRQENEVLRGAGTLAQVIGVAAAEQYFSEQEMIRKCNLRIALMRHNALATQHPLSHYYKPRR